MEKDKLIEYYNSNIGNEFDVEIAFLEGPPTKLLAYSTNKKSMKIAWVHIDMNNAHWTYTVSYTHLTLPTNSRV